MMYTEAIGDSGGGVYENPGLLVAVGMAVLTKGNVADVTYMGRTPVKV